MKNPTTAGYYWWLPPGRTCTPAIVYVEPASKDWWMSWCGSDQVETVSSCKGKLVGPLAPPKVS